MQAGEWNFTPLHLGEMVLRGPKTNVITDGNENIHNFTIIFFLLIWAYAQY